MEILLQAKANGLRVKKVSTTCNCDDVKNSKNTVRHGASVLMTLLKLVMEDRPLVFLGLPGILSLIPGTFFGVWMLRSYAIEQRISTNQALASMAFIFRGFFLLSTAITLYAIQRVAKKPVRIKETINL